MSAVDWADPAQHDDEVCAQEHYGSWGCIRGTIYGPCSSDNCYGVCSSEGPCECRCHAQGGQSVANELVDRRTRKMLGQEGVK